MSFASSVKDDLCRISTAKSCCKKAELSAFLLLNGSLRLGLKNSVALSMQTEHGGTARRIFSLAKEVYDMQSEIIVHRKDKLKKNQVYSLVMNPQDGVSTALAELGFSPEDIWKPDFTMLPKEHIWKNNCCKRALLRGAFLASGSVSDPQSGYHLEIVCNNPQQAEFLNMIFAELELHGGIVARKQSYVLYLKESEQIITFLALIGAHRTMMDFENVRIGKEIRNNVQRMLNAENANIDKTVAAALRQCEAIRKIDERIGIQKLSPALRQTAEIRLEYPEAPLQELSALLGIGKSGVNHRLRKLIEIAEMYEDENETTLND